MMFSTAKRQWRLAFALWAASLGLTAGSSFAIEGIYPKTPSLFARTDAYVSDHHRIQERLLSEAYRLSHYVNVPYIWGGKLIGQDEACRRCRRCVERRAVPLKQRLESCEACRFCGIDCSHLVQKIYDKAWLEFPYANVSLFIDHTEKGLRRQYGLVDIGRELKLVERGDILVYEKHMVMVVSSDGLGGGEVIHATMLGDDLNLGGIRLERHADLANFRGPLARILRHRSFFDGVEITARHFDPYHHDPFLADEVPRQLN